jgi:lipopolysaccharide biosynthesis glycosyltransferase
LTFIEESRIEVVPFQRGKHRANQFRGNVRSRLKQPHNAARYYIASALPELRKAIYIDADTLVTQGNDLVQLFDDVLEDEAAPHHIIAVASRGGHEPLRNFVAVEHEAIRSRVNVSADDPTFNNGFYVVRLDRWRRAGITKQLEDWKAINDANSGKLWRLNTQPPMLLALKDRVEWFDIEWNFAVRWLRDDTTRLAAKMLHFSGPTKPWLRGSMSHKGNKSQKALADRMWHRTFDEAHSRQCIIALHFHMLEPERVAFTRLRPASSQSVLWPFAGALTFFIGFVLGRLYDKLRFRVR